MLKEERGSLALDDQVALLLQSLASDAAAVRATALQVRAPSCLLTLRPMVTELLPAHPAKRSLNLPCGATIDYACTVHVQLGAECIFSYLRYAAKWMRCHNLQPVCFPHIIKSHFLIVCF